MVLSKNPANAAVVLAAVLGSRTVEMSGTQALTIHGARASRPAKVGSVDTGFCGSHGGKHCVIDPIVCIKF